MQIMKFKKSLPKTLIALISLVMIGGLFTVSLWVTDAEAQRRGAAGVGGGRVGRAPVWEAPQVSAAVRWGRALVMEAHG